MACLRDLPHVYRTVGVVTFARRIWREIEDDNLFTWAAALAYSWLFAIFPFLIFLLTLVPYLPDKTKAIAERGIHDTLYQALPSPDAADTVWLNIRDNVKNLLHQRQGRLLPRLMGIALSVWAASGGMSMTMAAFDKCYDIERGRSFHKQRALAMGLTLFVAVNIAFIVALLPVGRFMRDWVIAEDPDLAGSWMVCVFDVVRWATALFFMTSTLAVIYHVGPAVRQKFHWLTPGALFSVTVWLALGLLFRLYLSHFGRYNETYGTVGGVAVLLLFFYVDALVLLIGSEINSEIDFHVHSLRKGTQDFRGGASQALR